MAKLSDKEFLEMWDTHQSASAIAKIMDMDLRSIQKRRRNLEVVYGQSLYRKMYL